jgi:zinc transport system ATP-binding protein
VIPDPILTIAGLTVTYRAQTVLSDVSLQVARGSIHVIAGPNGAGKSTLLLAALGLTPFTGRIAATWRGSGAIGYVPQTFAVDRTLPVTVAEFLALTRQRRPICLGLSAATKARVSNLLAGVGLQDFSNRPLSVLSGGELRRVLLAHALDPLPELLILDEPATGLDKMAGRWLEEMLVAVSERKGVTVLMVSHDVEQTRRIAGHVTVLDRSVVADGGAAEALDQVQ